MEEQLDAQAEEIFEINDFTVVTEYERFAVQLEAIIHDWGIPGRRPSNEGHFDKRLKQQSTPVKFKDEEYTLLFYHFETADTPENTEEQEVTDDEDEQRMAYLPVAACEMTRQEFDLRRKDDVFTQYGVLEHLLLDPVNHTVDNQDLWRDILSVFNIVLLNSGCEIPLFVRFGEEKRNLYNGVVMNRNAQTLFEGVDGTDYLKKLGYFSGLVDLFREKVACEASDQPAIEATVQFDYVYQNDSIQEATDRDSNDGELNSDNFSMELDFGDTKSAVKKICLSVMWPRLNDETVNETDNFSDLDPYTSPRWLVEMKLDGSRKMLFSTMDELLDTKEMPASESRLTQFASIQQKEPELASALSMITRSHATDTTDIGFISGVSRSETQQHFINSVVRQVYENPFNDEPIANPTDFQSKCLAELQKSKTAPLNSLTLRISTVLAKCLNSEGGLVKMCTLWFDFVVAEVFDLWKGDYEENVLENKSNLNFNVWTLQNIKDLMSKQNNTKSKYKFFIYNSRTNNKL
ncbi:Rab3 GTPase-activating protein catalytic subunit [Aphelenchoides bicaudatus]|nr:Rab3 GTPase-activating protein catalytic subunit [Aphelenchoides bicaudatus]